MGGEPVRVMINDRCLRNVQTGVGRYVSELLAALPAADAGIEVLPFYRTYGRWWKSDRGRVKAPAGARGQARRAPDWVRRVLQGGYELAFRAVGKWHGYRLYHEPNHIPGLWDGPVVTTVHDLSVLRHPEWHPKDRVRWYEREMVGSLARSVHFISVSEFTKREMMELLGVPAERITVIPLGPRAMFGPRPAEGVREWLARRGLPAAYLLFVGTMEPRKNVSGLLAAYARLSEKQRREFPLLIAGAGGWGVESPEAQIERAGVAGDVRALGYVADEDLAWLYAGARALVWPTFYEGFGLPPLEAMTAGTPVIASDATSLPEVVGDAGVMVDARDAEALSEAMRRVIEDSAWCATLAERGLARSGRFSWERCAGAHAEIYRRYAER